MKKTLRTVALLLVMGAMSMPAVEARGRQDYSSSAQSAAAAPAHNQRPATGTPPSRPGNMGQRPGATTPSTRPGNSGNDYRPGNGNNNGNRPGNNNGNHNDYRPGGNNGNHNGNHNDYRPGHNHNDYRPGYGHNDYRPGHNHGNYDRYYWHTAPSRPYLPPSRPWFRPQPPRGWRPSPHWRPLTSVLGVNFGSAINISLNLLFNSGYAVNGYTNDAIYLTNVPMLNYYWDDATMYYNRGMLAGSEFISYSPYANSARYEMVYNTLCSAYGMPVSVNNAGGMTTASWWGNGGQYITLSYGPQYAGNGSLQFYTTLSFGV